MHDYNTIVGVISIRNDKVSYPAIQVVFMTKEQKQYKALIQADLMIAGNYGESDDKALRLQAAYHDALSIHFFREFISSTIDNDKTLDRTILRICILSASIVPALFVLNT